MTWHRNRLTKQQLNEARKRHNKREPMNEIARSFGVKPDWLKCLIDSEFYQRRLVARREGARRRRKQPAVGETDIQSQSNRRAVLSDLEFIAAMTRAVRSGRETAPEGTRKAPSTDNPRFTPMRGMGQLSLTGSTASQCADFA